MSKREYEKDKFLGLVVKYRNKFFHLVLLPSLRHGLVYQCNQ